MLLAALGVTAFMVFGLFPKLQKFLGGQHKKLPQMAQVLMDIATWMNANGIILLLIVLAVLVLAAVLYRLPWGRSRIDRGLLRLPLIGGLLRLAGPPRWPGGFPSCWTVESRCSWPCRPFGGCCSNRAMQTRLETVRGAVMEGSTLADPFIEGKEFTPMLGRMTAVGESTGTLGAVLDEVADFHEGQLAAAVRQLGVWVGPLTVIVVGVIVGFVYIAFFLTLLSVAGGVR